MYFYCININIDILNLIKIKFLKPLYRSVCSYFESPKPGKEIIGECVDRMRVSLLDVLRHRGPEQRLTLEFRHDVINICFLGKEGMLRKRTGVCLMTMILVNACYHLIGTVYMTSMGMVSNLDFLLK